jgi:vancomycin resistance protein YoaR
MKRILIFLVFLYFFAAFPLSSLGEEISQTDSVHQSFSGILKHDINLKVGTHEYPLSKSIVEKWTIERPDLFYNPNYRSEIERSDFCQYKKSFACELTFLAEQGYHIQKKSALEIFEKPISSFLDDLERQVNKDPENAKLKMEDGKVSVFSLSSDGIRLNKEKSLEILLDHLKNNDLESPIDLAYESISPEISTSSIENLGITSLIGEGRSNFRGSPKNRVFNINVATKRYDGIIIKPGEEFSFVKVLGEVDGEHGYLPELVIKKDKTEPEFGGGICQVSTTAFRAAIYSGLKITARRNHAYPVQYYNPQGMDATVYVPRPDLRFINNTPGYILIQTKIEGTELVFQFYGTDDGRKTSIIGPTITERSPDGSMKATFTQEVSDKEGNKMIEDVFNSAYDSPSKYPHPGQLLTEKPKDWSEKQWKQYKKDNNL